MLPPSQALALLYEVLSDPWQRHRFLDDSSAYLRSHLRSGGDPQLLDLRARIGKQVVVERDEAWWIEATGQHNQTVWIE